MKMIEQPICMVTAYVTPCIYSAEHLATLYIFIGPYTFHNLMHFINVFRIKILLLCKVNSIQLNYILGVGDKYLCTRKVNWKVMPHVLIFKCDSDLKVYSKSCGVLQKDRFLLNGDKVCSLSLCL